MVMQTVCVMTKTYRSRFIMGTRNPVAQKAVEREMTKQKNENEDGENKRCISPRHFLFDNNAKKYTRVRGPLHQSITVINYRRKKEKQFTEPTHVAVCYKSRILRTY